MPIDNDTLTFVPRLPCRSLPAFASVEQEQMQQTELDRAKHAQMQSEEKLSVKAADEPVTPAAPTQASNDHSQMRAALHLGRENDSSKHASMHEARHAAVHVAREGHPAKHEAVHVARQGRAAKHEAAHLAREGHTAKHEAVHVAREGHAAKHEAAHAPHAGRERHRSA